MKALIAKRAGRIRDRFLMRTSEIGSFTQARYGLLFAEKLYDEATRRKLVPGRYLFDSLPPETTGHVLKSPFDPYDEDMSVGQIFTWLWNHVVFDSDGNIVAIHDKGTILTNQHGWADELEWFSRIKKAEWLKRDREYVDG